MMRSVALGLYANLTTFDGTLDHGRVFSPTQLMIDLDVNQFLATYTQDPVVNDDTVAIDAILDVNWDETAYLTHPHTISHMRDIWQSGIVTPEIMSPSAGPGGTEKKILLHARELWQENLKRYRPPDHPADFLRELNQICDRAKKVLS